MKIHWHPKLGLVGLVLVAATALPAWSFEAPVYYPVGSGARDIATADLNQDGVLDLVTADHSGGLSVLLGAGDGTFLPATTWAAGDGPTSVAVADLDGDGVLDLASTSDGDDRISVLFGDGTGSFSAPAWDLVGTAPTWVGAGDLDRDGHLDLVVANQSDVAVLYGMGAGAFTAPVFFTADNQLSDGTLADFDDDGDLDLALTSRKADGVVLLLGDGSGDLGLPVTYPTGRDPQSILAVDVNQDGVLDLVTGNKQGESVSVLTGTGTGAFSSPTDYDASPVSSGLAWGDFDGDCTLDLAVTHSQGSGGLNVLAGDGAGGFWPPETTTLTANPKSMACGDLNGDMKPDLAVTATNGEVGVLLSDAASACGSFGVRRAGDPSTVRTAPLLAAPAVGPFDDASGTLSDGQVYYYVVDHAAEMPLRLSVHANDALDAVRLGFNDGNPTSASADPGAGFLGAAPGPVPADGVSTATVLLVPRDMDGVALGSGLTLTVDLALLAPGFLAAPVQDRGDGSYAVHVASTSAGAGVVSVQVEGLSLLEAPIVQFTAP